MSLPYHFYLETEQMRRMLENMEKSAPMTDEQMAECRALKDWLDARPHLFRDWRYKRSLSVHMMLLQLVNEAREANPPRDIMSWGICSMPRAITARQ